jgi:hypothetical protein
MVREREGERKREGERRQGERRRDNRKRKGGRGRIYYILSFSSPPQLSVANIAKRGFVFLEFLVLRKWNMYTECYFL